MSFDFNDQNSLDQFEQQVKSYMLCKYNLTPSLSSQILKGLLLKQTKSMLIARIQEYWTIIINNPKFDDKIIKCCINDLFQSIALLRKHL